MQAAADSGIGEFRCQAGYFTVDGIALLVPVLKDCAERSATLKFVLGSNDGGTLANHVAYLAGALGLPREHVSLGIVGFAGALFHPKVYHVLRSDGSQTAYVGSANLTGPGISGLNIEAGIVLDTAEADEPAVLSQIAARIDGWFSAGATGIAPVKSAQDIDNLLASGRLALAPSRTSTSENDQTPQSSQDAASGSLPRLGQLFQLPRSPLSAAPSPSITVAQTTGGATDAGGRSVVPAPFVDRTEASFHFPQGTHLGHILAILYYFASDRADTPFDDHYIRLSGSLGTGRVATYRRQIKYKLLAAIELGLVTDIRDVKDPTQYVPSLTPLGTALWSALSPHIQPPDLIFDAEDAESLSTAMPQRPAYYNELLAGIQRIDARAGALYRSVVLNMPAAKLMLRFLYQEVREARINKATIYDGFFASPAVVRFCDLMGIEPATTEGAKHRLPFLFNILESCGIVSQSPAEVRVEKLAVSADLLVADGAPSAAPELVRAVLEWSEDALDEGQRVELRALFGPDFLTSRYALQHTLEIES